MARTGFVFQRGKPGIGQTGLLIGFFQTPLAVKTLSLGLSCALTLLHTNPPLRTQPPGRPEKQGKQRKRRNYALLVFRCTLLPQQHNHFSQTEYSIYDLASIHRYINIPLLVTEGKAKQERAAGEKRSREGKDEEQDHLSVGDNLQQCLHAACFVQNSSVLLYYIGILCVSGSECDLSGASGQRARLKEKGKLVCRKR